MHGGCFLACKLQGRVHAAAARAGMHPGQRTYVGTYRIVAP